MENKLESKANDKTILSTHNLIPNNRPLTQKDIDEFIKNLKRNNNDVKRKID